MSWKTATQELRKAGIVVNTSLSGCCLGCVENSPIPDDVPALYQLRKRWSSTNGYLCHQNLGDTMLAIQIVQILTKHRVKWEWDLSQGRSLHILGEAN